MPLEAPVTTMTWSAIDLRETGMRSGVQHAYPAGFCATERSIVRGKISVRQLGHHQCHSRTNVTRRLVSEDWAIGLVGLPTRLRSRRYDTCYLCAHSAGALNESRQPPRAEPKESACNSTKHLRGKAKPAQPA